MDARLSWLLPLPDDKSSSQCMSSQPSRMLGFSICAQLVGLCSIIILEILFKCNFYKLPYLPIVSIAQALPGRPCLFQTNTGQGVWFQQKEEALMGAI